MSKTKTICFTNNKGGSGKSTACANLAYELSKAGKKVLLIDGDMQLNLSLSFFDEDRVLDMAECEENLYYAIRGKKDLKDYVIKVNKFLHNSNNTRPDKLAYKERDDLLTKELELFEKFEKWEK